MLQRLMNIPNLKMDNRYILPKFEKLSSDIDKRLETLKIRYFNTEMVDSYSVQLIRQMLDISGDIIRELFFIKDDSARLMYLLNPKIQLFLEQRIDSFRTNTFFNKTFIKGADNKPTVESIIPVTMDDPLGSLPIMDYEAYKWMDIKPIRIVYFDSNELVSEIIGDPCLFFKRDKPSISIITFDMIQIVMKLVKYCEKIQNEFDTVNFSFPNSELPVNSFLKEEVFYNLYDDSKDVWILNLFIRMFEEDIDIKKLSDEFKKNHYTVADYTTYLFDIKKLIDQTKEGKIDVRYLLNARMFGKESLMERLSYIYRNLRTKELRQYAHLDLSIHLPYLLLVLKIINFSKNTSLKRTVSYEMRRRLDIYKRNKLHLQFKNYSMNLWFLNLIEQLDTTIIKLENP